MKRLLLVLCVIFAGCSDASTAEKTLRGMGYNEIQTKGWAWFGCSEDDTFRTKFVAKHANGTQVSGVVCNGWFKGATVRFD